MASLLSSLAKRLRKVYQKAEEFLEEEREFPFSQVFLNATMERYVTEKVSVLDDLHADLHDDWLRLYATLNVKGLHTILSVDLKLLQMELNKDAQFMVFEQISKTQVIEATFKNVLQKWAFNIALYFYQGILDKDPLGMILERFNVVKVQDGLLYLDLNQWLSTKQKIIDTLAKVHVNHAFVREGELVVLGNVNLTALFYPSNDEYDDEDKVEAIVDVQSG